MAYIDLNLVRAKMATTPEESDYTSIKERIRPSFNLESASKEQISEQNLFRFAIDLKPMAKFEGDEKTSTNKVYSLTDYFELVDYTGRIIRPDKRGSIPITLPPILNRIDIDLSIWLKNSTEFESVYHAKFGKRKSRQPLAQTG